MRMLQREKYTWQSFREILARSLLEPVKPVELNGGGGPPRMPQKWLLMVFCSAACTDEKKRGQRQAGFDLKRNIQMNLVGKLSI